MSRYLVERTTPVPRRLVLADESYDAIKRLILEHKISPGQHIGIDDLSRDLVVSQTPIREALARLESDGLVTKTPLRGYKATNLLSVQQFDELFQFRGLIEPWAASEAARRSTRLDDEALDAELERAEHIAASGAESTYPEFIEHDTRFHALIAHASGNEFIEDSFSRTHCHMHLFRVYNATLIQEASDPSDGRFVLNMFAEYYNGGTRPLALTEHVAIARAVRAGDTVAARELMLNHIASSRRRFIPAVEALTQRVDSRPLR